MFKKTLLCFSFCLPSVVLGQTPEDSTSVAANDSTVWENTLGDITVTAQRQLVKQDIDRIGYDVQADENAKTETVLDILRKVPMVAVDGEDNIMVKGSSNFRIYKNGHLDPSLSKNAKEILKAMPASSVKRIEVITDPGAREDAEGVNAILNIVMMDNRLMDGVMGSVTAGYTSLRHANLGTYLAAQFGKLVVSLDYGYGGMTRKETKSNGFVERSFVKTGNKEQVITDGTNPGNVHYADINASYEIDTLNLLSASFGGYFYKLDVAGNTQTLMFNPEGTKIYSFREDYWLPDYGHHSWNGRLDYEHKTRCKDEKLTFSYMIALTRQHSDQETTFSELFNVPFSYNGYLSKSKERFTEHTIQLDYLRPLWEGHQLEVGAKYIHRQNESENSQQFYAADVEPSEGAFDHTMQIAASYIDYLFNKGKWSARAGLRYEYSFMKGHYPEGKSTDFDKYLSDWVPQLSVKYQVNDRQSLKLAYTTSITRPGITYLNPAVVSTPGRVDFGNAHLSSAREQSIQLHYMYVGERLTLQVVPQYQFFNNALGAIVYAEGDIRYGTWGNVLKQNRFQLEGYAQWKPFDNTTFVANINLTDNYAENSASNLKQHLTSMFYYVNVAQKLPWRLNVTAYSYGQVGHSPENIYAYGRSWRSYGFTLQRSFLSNDRLTVRLSALMPFHKDMHFKTHTTQGDILGYGNNVNAQNGRQFRLSVTFRFGKLNTSVRKTDTTIENDDLVGGITRGNN